MESQLPSNSATNLAQRGFEPVQGLGPAATVSESDKEHLAPAAVKRWIRLDPITIVVLFIITAAAAIAAYLLWDFLRTYEMTDDAYVVAHIHPVHAQVDGQVVAVYVEDNQMVKKDERLVLIDPTLYRIALQESQSALSQAQSEAAEAKAVISMNSLNARGASESASGGAIQANANLLVARENVSKCKTDVAVAEAELRKVQAAGKFSKATLERYTWLAKQGALSQQDVDRWTAYHDEDLAAEQAAVRKVEEEKENLNSALESVQKLEGEIVSSQGQMDRSRATAAGLTVDTAKYQSSLAAVERCNASVADARVRLSLCTVKATNNGRIGNRIVEVGQRLQLGQQLMSIVEEGPWVVANFKETQVRFMQPGQPAEIVLDARPGRKFQGYIDSLSPASGAEFALLPTDNATGNFTKIVQRIPVKIVFERASLRGWEARVNPGMSAVISVKVK